MPGKEAGIDRVPAILECQVRRERNAANVGLWVSPPLGEGGEVPRRHNAADAGTGRHRPSVCRTWRKLVDKQMISAAKIITKGLVS